jgi:hypothetical protein
LQRGSRALKKCSSHPRFEIIAAPKNPALNASNARAEGGHPMTVTGAVFQPELIELMRSVLEEAAATLPEAKRTSTMKAEIASQILACAARGERNPTALKMAALLGVVECSHYSHDISPERRAV